MKLYLPLFLSVFLFACAPVISQKTKDEADLSLHFKEVAQNPDAYDGKVVLWGGEIIQILPRDDGITLIEVLEWPLGWREKPQKTVSFRGKFLVVLKEPLDTSRYGSRARVTVAGEIQGSMQGEKIESVSDPAYRYPLLLGKEIHVWTPDLYQYSYVPDVGETLEYSGFERVLRY